MSPKSRYLWLLPLGPDQVRRLLPHRTQLVTAGCQQLRKDVSGGEGGIRTLETRKRLYDFQSYALDQTMRPLHIRF